MTDLREVIFGCEGPQLTSAEAAFFGASNPFGFILFARNMENPAQVAALTDQLRSAVGWHAPVFIDQEGGRVQRMGPPHWHQYPAALDQAESKDAERLFWLRGCLIGAELASVGIDANCAPLADVARAETHPVLRNRCYGSDPETVTRNALAMVAGQAAAGVASVLKHIPGHGLATVDSHLDLPTVTLDRDTLTAQDFAPFKSLNHIDMGMTAHIVFDQIDPTAPATQSPVMLDLIRNDIGFDGLLMTDDISMEALNGTVATRATRALAAGCDLVLHCNGDLAEMQSLADVCGPFEGTAANRAELALKNRPSPQDVDIAALKAEFAALTGS